MTDPLSIEGNRSTSDKYQKQSPPRCRFCGERHYHRDSPLQRCRCQNCNENGHKEGPYRESSTSSSTRQNPNNKNFNSDEAKLWLTMAPIPSTFPTQMTLRESTDGCDAKTIFMVYYVENRNINLVVLYWIDELNLSYFPN
ncbi:unnamed protein product [Hymenolepis diminuta]|uniref:Uncharacterized protein n=1 Tax=Hymenolepis diminuta TaxID=6216 RepID=A0A564Z1V5_HYMDI|nr:unnamed protein product [Hymenolepis diminuta]